MKDDGYARRGKRVLDVAMSGAALAVFWPVLLGVAAVVRTQLGSPVLFRQRRPGRDGRPFTILKFRTMTDARDPEGALLSDGQRLTRVGRWLRRSSLDELPELINVLRGDMSLVGPRPLLDRYRPFFSTRERTRESVRPGITGRAQIMGRNRLPWTERLEADARYVETLSLHQDVRILFDTVLAVVSARGVEQDAPAAMDDLNVERRLRVGGLGPQHAEALVDLQRASFEPDELQTTIFAGHGVARYYADVLDRGREHSAIGAFEGDTLVGYAHIREQPGRSHLNQIATSPEARGRGVGRALFEAWERQARSSLLSLDVRDGTLAAAWYRRRGFQPRTQSVLWRIPPARAVDARHARLEASAKDAARHRRYGFSRAVVHGAAQPLVVGCLGEHALRIDAACSADALEAARAAVPQRRILVVGTGKPPLRGAQRLHTVLRMERRVS